MSDCKECAGYREALECIAESMFPATLETRADADAWMRKTARAALQRRKSERRRLPQDQASAGNRRTTVDRRDGK